MIKQVSSIVKHLKTEVMGVMIEIMTLVMMVIDEEEVVVAMMFLISWERVKERKS